VLNAEWPVPPGTMGPRYPTLKIRARRFTVLSRDRGSDRRSRELFSYVDLEKPGELIIRI
jgi:hypothetical protein